ncbi:MAG: DUF3108 domain-containing protein [Bacteroidetes bacterium]|nr:DUF3108 domain-containing protein [Bacteroidota bacterium]
MIILNKVKSISLLAFLMLVFMAFKPVSTGLDTVSMAAPTAEEINACTVTNTTFRSGEEVTYKIYYNLNFVWIPAGEVVFKVDGMDGQYHLSATGKTYSSYEWFFKVRDQYDSYIDSETLLPYLSIRDVQEGGYTLYEKTTFNQRSNKAHVVRGRAIDNIKEDKEFSINSCMHDVLSIVYYARNLDFSSYDEGHDFPINIFMDKEEWPLNVQYKGKESDVKIKGLGRFNTIKFSPQLISGEVFPDDAQMTVWVSDDRNKVPVMIESPLSVGSVKAVLKDYKGLRYEMKAQTK